MMTHPIPPVDRALEPALRAAKYFPRVGLLIGAFLGVVLLAASRGEVLLACAFALAGVVVAVLAARLAMRLLGGHTGDVAGAIEQLFELAVLLAVAAWGR